jgi:hypothetical protein
MGQRARRVAQSTSPWPGGGADVREAYGTAVAQPVNPVDSPLPVG